MKSSYQWLLYYKANARDLLPVPWETGAELTAVERDAIASSLQKFQLGESSEGRNLLRRAQEYAQSNNELAYVEAIRLFIREEQRHAATLGRFMKLQGIPTIHRNFSDSVFRRLRKFAGLELSVAVLVTAEIIAKVYYDAILSATRSSVLQAICRQVLRDEVAHVTFQCERLARMRMNMPWHSIALREALHAFLFAGTSVVVWRDHRHAFLAGGYDLRRYWNSCWDEFASARRMMNPIAYIGVNTYLVREAGRLGEEIASNAEH